MGSGAPVSQKIDVAAEAAKASFPVGVSLATLGGLTLHDLVMLATLVYIVLQAAYLLWKWYRQATSEKGGDSAC